jgi:hypothetical protein
MTSRGADSAPVGSGHKYEVALRGNRSRKAKGHNEIRLNIDNHVDNHEDHHKRRR